MANTQKELKKAERASALERLAEAGGNELVDPDELVFEGTRIVLPETLRDNVGEAIRLLRAREEADEMQTAFDRTFPYRPMDGAHAVTLAIRQIAGFATQKPIVTFFGSTPPSLIDVDIDVDRTIQVPWGRMGIPGLQNTTVTLTEGSDPELGVCFRLYVQAPRKYRRHIDGLFRLVERYLQTQSIYRGKVIDGAPRPGFIDVSVIDPNDVVYSTEVLTQLETHVWSPIRHMLALEKLGQRSKRAVLLEGPFGSGKTLAALLTAQVAKAHGWTFLMCRPGQDDLLTTMATARMYQPAVVFYEDVDLAAGEGDDADRISAVLDAFDGIRSKGLRMLLVLTTNHADRIVKGMVRPGRLDAVVPIGGMDRAGIERLSRRVIGTLDRDVDFDVVAVAMDGYMPAYVREALDRAVRYNVARNDGRLGPIGTADLVAAAEGLRAQLALQEAAPEAAGRPSLDRALRDAVVSVVHGTVVHEPGDPDYQRFELAVPSRNGGGD
jgi:transitional endoplasmic reticulum ATPase